MGQSCQRSYLDCDIAYYIWYEIPFCGTLFALKRIFMKKEHIDFFRYKLYTVNIISKNIDLR